MRRWAGIVLVGLLACESESKDVKTVEVAAEPSPRPDAADVARVPAGDLRVEHGVIKFAVYALPSGKRGLEATAKAVRDREFPRLHLADSTALTEGPSVYIVSPPMGEFSPPDVEALRSMGWGLTQAQAHAVQKSPEAVVMAFAGPPEHLATLHRDALRMTSAVAAEAQGLVWDEDTRQMFGFEAWSHRVKSDPYEAKTLGQHFAIRSSRHGEFVRLITSGMQKFALPDLLARDVPPALAGPMAMLLHLVAATIVAEPVLAKAGELTVDFDKLGLDVPLGAERSVVVTLMRAERRDGDPENRIAEVSFPGEASGRHERIAALLQKVTGAKDKATRSKLDPAVVEASLAAKNALKRLKPQFQAGLSKGETLLVKAPFATRDHNKEWMWVEVLRWEGETLHGILQNDPAYVDDLEAGSKVDVVESTLFDYIHKQADGTIIGNETAKLMEHNEAFADRGWSAGMDPFASQKKLGQ